MPPKKKTTDDEIDEVTGVEPTKAPVSNLDRLRKRAQRTTTLVLPVDPNDTDRLDKARAAKERTLRDLERARRTAELDPRSASAREAVEAADAAHDAAVDALAALEAEVATFTLHLSALSTGRIEELRLDHKPTDKQRKNAKAMANGDPKAQPFFNEETYIPALLAEATVKITFSDDPDHPIMGVDADQAADIVANWSVGDRVLAYQAVELLSQSPSRVEDLGKG